VPKILTNRPPHIKNLEAVQALVGNGTNAEIAEELGVSTVCYSKWKSSGKSIPSEHLKKLVTLSDNRFNVEDFLPHG